MSSPDTLQVLLTGFTLAWLSGFLQPKRKFFEPSGCSTVINCVFTFHTTNDFGCLCGIMAQFWTYKADVPELDYVARSSVWLLNHTLKETMHNMLTHYLPRYYQPQQVPWTVLITWYMLHKQVYTKILLNFWLTLLYRSVSHYQLVYMIKIIVCTTYMFRSAKVCGKSV